MIASWYSVSARPRKRRLRARHNDDDNTMLSASGGGGGGLMPSATRASGASLDAIADGRELAMALLKDALRPAMARCVREMYQDATIGAMDCDDDGDDQHRLASSRFCSLLREVPDWSGALVKAEFDGGGALKLVTAHLEPTLIGCALVMHQLRRRDRQGGTLSDAALHVRIPSARRFAHGCLTRLARRLYEREATTASGGGGGGGGYRSSIADDAALTALIDECIELEAYHAAATATTGAAADRRVRRVTLSPSSERRDDGGRRHSGGRLHHAKPHHRRHSGRCHSDKHHRHSGARHHSNRDYYHPDIVAAAAQQRSPLIGTVAHQPTNAAAQPMPTMPPAATHVSMAHVEPRAPSVLGNGAQHSAAPLPQVAAPASLADVKPTPSRVERRSPPRYLLDQGTRRDGEHLSSYRRAMHDDDDNTSIVSRLELTLDDERSYRHASQHQIDVVESRANGGGGALPRRNDDDDDDDDDVYYISPYDSVTYIGRNAESPPASYSSAH